MQTRSESSKARGILAGVRFLGPGLLLLWCSFVVEAQENASPAEQPAAEFQRPKYQVQRHTEDWSGLADRDRAETGDVFDPIKYLPLLQDDVWVSFGGQVRSRIESWEDFGFGGAGERDDVFWLNRLRYHADLHATKYLRAFFEGKSAFSSDRDLPGGRRTLDVDEFDLQNGFIDVRLPLGEEGSLTLRPGRQELLFGKQRLISPLDWANTRRTFDGVSGIFELQEWTFTGFYTQFVPVDRYDFNEPDAQTEFYGAYAAGKVPKLDLGLDLYLLGLSKDRSAVGPGVNGTVGREDRFTLGGRLGGKVGDTALDFDLEGAYQFGELGGNDVDAFMVTTEAGYSLAEVKAKPRLALGFGYASGDHSPGGDVQTFNQLFPLGHAYLGYIDAVGRQNVIDARTSLSVRPTKKVTLAAQGHYFWRADRGDALYNAGGGVVRPGGGGNSRDVGAELDLTVKYSVDLHTLVAGGYSHFFPGDFIEQSGRSKGIDFAHLALQYTF